MRTKFVIIEENRENEKVHDLSTQGEMSLYELKKYPLREEITILCIFYYLILYSCVVEITALHTLHSFLCVIYM